MSIQAIAFLLVAGFLVLAVFQAAIALGAPVGRAAWGGRTPGVLPTNLRLASAVSVLVYLIAAVIVLDRAGMPLLDLPDWLSSAATWALVALLGLGAIMNFASSSPFERFGWAPLATIMAVLTLMLALS